jgi:hypothetical protein
MTWLYQGNPVEQLPEDCAGFVYEITNLITQRKYIGKKLARFRKTRQRTVKFKNGNKRKRKTSSAKYFTIAKAGQNAATSRQENNLVSVC